MPPCGHWRQRLKESVFDHVQRATSHYGLFIENWCTFWWSNCCVPVWNILFTTQLKWHQKQEVQQYFKVHAHFGLLWPSFGSQWKLWSLALWYFPLMLFLTPPAAAFTPTVFCCPKIQWGPKIWWVAIPVPLSWPYPYFRGTFYWAFALKSISLRLESSSENIPFGGLDDHS